MKKVLHYLLFLIIMFLILTISTSAEENYYVFNNYISNLNINASDEIGSAVFYMPIGTSLKAVDNKKHGTACGGMYKVIYNENGDTGYVCSSLTDIYQIDLNLKSVSDESFQAILNSFPESYRPYLIYLHSIYPNALFTPINTNLEWSYMTANESNTLNKSLIQISGNDRDGWKNPLSWNSATNSYKVYEGTNWYSASESVVSLYLDPRNFLNKASVFQFENLNFTDGIYSSSGLKNIVKDTFLDSNITDANNNTFSYIDTIMQAGINNGISPYHIAARILQEQGTKGAASMISGTVSGYEGFYNYYNIKASSGDNKYLQYAVNNGWNNRYTAVVGGAKFLKDKFINVCSGLTCQNTLYAQKWDYVGESYTSHQYMQNIQAPSSEAIMMYKAYKVDENFYNKNYVFNIPVYNNMPNEIVKTPSIEQTEVIVDKTVATPVAVEVIKYGDVNKDNSIDTLDLLAVKKHLLNLDVLVDRNLKAADVNKDGNVDTLDLLMIKKHLLGIESL